MSWELLVVGLGFWLDRRRAIGVALFVSHLLAVAAMLATVEPSAPVEFLWAGACVLLVGRPVSLVWLYLSVRKRSGHGTGEDRRWKGVFFTTLLPGLGHLVLKRWLGILFLPLLFLVGLVVEFTGLSEVPFAAECCVAVFVALVIWHVARKGKGADPLPTKVLLRFVVAWAVLIQFILLPTIQGVKSAWAMPYSIAGGSMRPTLQLDERVLVDMRGRPVQRWDVIVVENPVDASGEYRYPLGGAIVKRLVGMPGDCIEFDDEGLLINGERALHPPGLDAIRYTWSDEPFLRGNSRIVRVPADSCFLLGDKPDRSRDSREWGCVAQKDVAGKVVRVWWPPSAARLVK